MLLEDVLLIFAKYPQAGFVKTRLAKDIGKEKASLLYRLFVEATLKRTENRRFKRIVFYSPANKKNEITDWLGNGFKMHSQKGDDLGDRLSYAFKFAFKNKAKRVIAIGTDSPTIDKILIEKAFKRLKDVNCVLGPALDGGYYLIGLTHFYPEIFTSINWGKDDVLDKTKYKLHKLGLEFSLLEPYLDIDSLKDLYLFKRQLKNNLKINPLGLEEIDRVFKSSIIKQKEKNE